MADAADPNLDELRRRGRRRLIGAIVLALVAAVVVPMLLESDPRPRGEDVSGRIPPVDEGKPVNRLSSPKSRADAPGAPLRAETSKGDGQPSVPAGAAQSGAPGAGSPPTPPESPAPAPDAAKSASSPSDAGAKGDAPRKSVVDAEKSVLAPGTRVVPLEPSKAALDQPKGEASAPAKAATAPKAATAAAPPASKATPSPPAATPPATKTTTSPPAAKDGYVVQLGAFTDDKGANALVNRLRKVGHPAYTESLATSRGALWRVRVGPYPSRDAATQVRERLKAEGQAGIVVQAR